MINHLSEQFDMLRTSVFPAHVEVGYVSCTLIVSNVTGQQKIGPDPLTSVKGAGVETGDGTVDSL